MTSYEIERSLVYLAKQIIKTFGEDTELQDLIKQEDCNPIIKKKYRNIVRAWCELYDKYSSFRTWIGSDYISLYIDGVKGYSSSVGIDLPINAFRKIPENNNYYSITQLIGD